MVRSYYCQWKVGIPVAWASLLFFFVLPLPITAQTVTGACCNGSYCSNQLPVTLHALIDTTNNGNLEGHRYREAYNNLYSHPVDIGFPFEFYGYAYSYCVITNKGFICFDTTRAMHNLPAGVLGPIPGTLLPGNSIFGCFQEMGPYYNVGLIN